jgi:hypothetical protein
VALNASAHEPGAIRLAVLLIAGAVGFKSVPALLCPPLNVSLDEGKVGESVAAAQKPLADQLERLAIQVVREKGVEIQPLREILRKMGETSFRDDDIPKRRDEKADAMIKLRPETASRRQQGPAELASFAQKSKR